MKGNKKYIYICLTVVMIAIVGYVVIYKLDILKNKNNDKETTKEEVAKTEVSTNDELLNDPNVKYGKEETGKIIKNKGSMSRWGDKNPLTRLVALFS